MPLTLVVKIAVALRYEFQRIEKDERSFGAKIVQGHVRVIGKDGCTSCSGRCCAVNICLFWHDLQGIVMRDILSEIVKHTGHKERWWRQLLLAWRGKSLPPYRASQARDISRRFCRARRLEGTRILFSVAIQQSTSLLKALETRCLLTNWQGTIEIYSFSIIVS